MSVSRKALIDALWKRSRSVLAYIEGEAVYLLEDAALALKAPVANEETLAAAANALDTHRWKTMGVASVECECGAILAVDSAATDDAVEDDVLRAFPADAAFRAHLARAVLEAVEAVR